MSMPQHPRPTRSTPLGPSPRPMMRPSGDIQPHSKLDIENDLIEKERQLEECTSAIQRNVLTRQIRQLQDRLANDEKSQRSSPNHTTSSSLLPPAPLTGPTQRRSKTPTADRRNTDIEFATEIGQGLLLEVRKMQVLLQEKEEQLRALDIEKTDLERSAEAMAKQLRQREESEEHLKEETWNLELSKQELTLSVTEMQHQLDKSGHEHTKLTQQVSTLQNVMEQLRGREEKLAESLEQTKQRHEQDMGNMRRHCAGYQREAQQHAKHIEALTSELAIAKAQSRLSKQQSSHHPSPNAATTADDTASSGTDSTQNRSHHHHHHHMQNSPGSESPAMEVETLKTSLGHAHRMVNNLRSNLHKEKTEKFELKKLLAESQETIEQLQNDPHLWVEVADDQQKKQQRKVKQQQQNQRRSKKTTALRGARRTATAMATKHTPDTGDNDSDISDTNGFDDDYNDDDDYSSVSNNDENDNVPAGFTSLSLELSQSTTKLSNEEPRANQLQRQLETWDHVGLTTKHLTCIDQAPVTLCETTTQTVSQVADADLRHISSAVHQAVQCCDLSFQDLHLAPSLTSSDSVHQGVQCNLQLQDNSGATIGDLEVASSPSKHVNQGVQYITRATVDTGVQHECTTPAIDQHTQSIGVTTKDSAVQYEQSDDTSTTDWLGSLNDTNLSLDSVCNKYTQEQVDDAVAKAMTDYKARLGIKEGEEEQEMILVPARPHQPPPSILLDKATRTTASTTQEYLDDTLSSSSSTISSNIDTPTHSDPTITSITQTMIGEWLTKYPRKHMGGFSERRQHQRYFWIHPYTRTLYWSEHAPGSANGGSKNALVENVTVGYPDEDSDVPFLFVHTSERPLKIKAPTLERHDIWLQSLNYLVVKPGPSPEIMPRRSVSASILRKPSFQRISDMFHRNPSIHTASSIHNHEEDDDDDEGLENVRLCCGGKHDIGALDHHHHHRHRKLNSTSYT